MSLAIVVLVLTFFGPASKLLDSTLGLGYGTLLVPLLQFFGYSVERVISTVLISEFLSSRLTVLLHSLAGNIGGDVSSRDFKVVTVMSMLGVGLAVDSATSVMILFVLALVFVQYRNERLSSEKPEEYWNHSLSDYELLQSEHIGRRGMASL